jgi:hypothetical protein
MGCGPWSSSLIHPEASPQERHIEGMIPQPLIRPLPLPHAQGLGGIEQAELLYTIQPFPLRLLFFGRLHSLGLGLAGHLGPTVLLGECYQNRSRVAFSGSQNVILASMFLTFWGGSST